MSNVDTLPASDTTLVVRRTYDVPRERLFEAWLNPKMLRRFMNPGESVCEEVSVDARVGGAYRIAMNNEGEPFIVSGTYVDITKPERISFTWSWDEEDPALQHESQVTLEFFERGAGKTELVLTHERLASRESRDRHAGGWTSILELIDRAVASHPFSIQGIDFTGYMTTDAARSIAFYRDAFGLEPVEVYSDNRGAEYELPDGTTFGLWGAGGPIPFQPSNGILFHVDDFDGAVRAIKTRGIPIAMELDLPRCRMAGVLDPDGNLFVLHDRKVK